MPIQELNFSVHDVSDQGSLALFLLAHASRCGIYWIDFADKTSYVGQSVSVRTRLATHRRRWADVEKIRFAECPEHRLDELERAAIAHAEKLRPLRNKLLAARPGGPNDLVVTLTEGQSLALPWERSRRGETTDIGETRVHAAPTTAQSVAFRLLAATPCYEEIRGILNALLMAAVPSPHKSQFVLWTITALPSTSKMAGWRRLITLNAGRLEILRIFENKEPSGVTYPSFLNLHSELPEAQAQSILEDSSVSCATVERREYSKHTEVLTIELSTLGELARVLRDSRALDEVYKLVVSVMRQGSNPLQRWHNWELAADVLRGSVTATN